MIDKTAAFGTATPAWRLEPPRRHWFDIPPRWRVALLAQTVELGAMTLAALLACLLNAAGAQTHPGAYPLACLALGVSAYGGFLRAGLYAPDQLLDSARALKPLLAWWTAVFAVLAAAAALAHVSNEFSRLWFMELYAGGFFVIALERWALEHRLRRRIAAGLHLKTVAIVGANALAEQLIARLAGNRAGIRVLGVFDDRAATPERPLRTLGTLAQLSDYSRNAAIDLVVITLPIEITGRFQQIIAQLRDLPLDIRVLPGPLGLETISPLHCGRGELPGIQLISVTDRPLSDLAAFAKRLIDIIVAAAALLCLSPLLLVCAGGIALGSPGPVLFHQRRVGFKGRPFEIVKFRTMHARHPVPDVSTRRGDPRIFPFGGWLRKFSLDELPQFYNVLKGEMSLVGPRPHMLGQQVNGQSFFQAVNEYAGRHKVKPGLTGWAQVNGWRGPAENLEQIRRRVEHDIYYIENWSILLDLVILIKTLFVGFRGKNVF